MTHTNQHYDSGDYPRALECALRAIGYDDFAAERTGAAAQGRLLGLGLSCYVEPTGMNSRVFEARGMVGVEGFDGAHVAVTASGDVSVWTTTPTVGQGADTTFAQLVADELALEPGRVLVAKADTSVGGLAGTGTFASRSAVSTGGALVRAAAELHDRLRSDGARRLDATPNEVELEGGAVHGAGGSVSFAELFAAAEPGRYAVSAQWDPPAVAYPYATHACVVEVDADTGGVTILRYAIVDDCGRVINPLVVAGQVHGATAQGIAEAIFESVVYDADGQPQNASLMDFLVPTAAELPAFRLEHLETPAPTTVNGVKGVGEGGTIGAAGAVANAVCDAVGVQLNEIPLHPEIVREAARRTLRA